MYAELRVPVENTWVQGQDEVPGPEIIAGPVSIIRINSDSELNMAYFATE